LDINDFLQFLQALGINSISWIIGSLINFVSVEIGVNELV